MSEYQYYEFQAIDRPLTDVEFKKVKNLSTRGEVSKNQAIFVYNYSDFRHEPLEVLAAYFDMMLYIANWGARRLCFRLPKRLVSLKQISCYCIPDMITVSSVNEYLILDIEFNSGENDGWIDGNDILSDMLSLRDDLLQGDYRLLYIASLSFLAENYHDEVPDQLEPPIPPGLKNISMPLKRFIDFFKIDPDLIEVAAKTSAEQPNDNVDIKQFLSELTEKERNEFLLQLLNGEPNVDKHLSKRLREIANNAQPKQVIAQPLRTVEELFTAAEKLTQAKREKQHRKKEAARVSKLDALIPLEKKIWQEVFNHLNAKTSKGYDQAVKLLNNLKQLADHLGTQDQFIVKVKKIQKDFSRSSSLKSKMIDQGRI